VCTTCNIRVPPKTVVFTKKSRQGYRNFRCSRRNGGRGGPGCRKTYTPVSLINLMETQANPETLAVIRRIKERLKFEDEATDSPTVPSQQINSEDYLNDTSLDDFFPEGSLSSFHV
jgi:hypothetical protein